MRWKETLVHATPKRLDIERPKKRAVLAEELFTLGGVLKLKERQRGGTKYVLFLQGENERETKRMAKGLEACEKDEIFL